MGTEMVGHRRRAALGAVLCVGAAVGVVQLPACRTPDSTDTRRDSSDAEQPTGLEAQLQALVARAGMPGSLDSTPVEFARGLDLIKRCGDSGNPQLMTKLRELANGPAQRTVIGLAALGALKELGEHQSQFLLLVENYMSRPQLAAYAMRIAGSEPEASTVARFKQIAAHAQEAHLQDWQIIRSAASEVQDVMRMKSELLALQNVTARAEYLFPRAIGGLLPPWMGFAEAESTEARLDPAVVWSRTELRSLSQAEPVACAEALNSSLLRGVCQSEPSDAEKAACLAVYRRWIAQFLAPNSRQAFSQLVALGSSAAHSW